MHLFENMQYALIRKYAIKYALIWKYAIKYAHIRKYAIKYAIKYTLIWKYAMKYALIRKHSNKTGVYVIRKLKNWRYLITWNAESNQEKNMHIHIYTSSVTNTKNDGRIQIFQR